MWLGSCPECKSAGTVGYECQQCHRERYKNFGKTVEGKRMILTWYGLIYLAENYGQDVCLIVPLCPIMAAGPEHQS